MTEQWQPDWVVVSLFSRSYQRLKRDISGFSNLPLDTSIYKWKPRLLKFIEYSSRELCKHIQNIFGSVRRDKEGQVAVLANFYTWNRWLTAVSAYKTLPSSFPMAVLDFTHAQPVASPLRRKNTVTKLVYENFANMINSRSRICYVAKWNDLIK